MIVSAAQHAVERCALDCPACGKLLQHLQLLLSLQHNVQQVQCLAGSCASRWLEAPLTQGLEST